MSMIYLFMLRQYANTPMCQIVGNYQTFKSRITVSCFSLYLWCLEIKFSFLALHFVVNVMTIYYPSHSVFRSICLFIRVKACIVTDLNVVCFGSSFFLPIFKYDEQTQYSNTSRSLLNFQILSKCYPGMLFLQKNFYITNCINIEHHYHHQYFRLVWSISFPFIQLS